MEESTFPTFPTNLSDVWGFFVYFFSSFSTLQRPCLFCVTSTMPAVPELALSVFIWCGAFCLAGTNLGQYIVTSVLVAAPRLVSQLRLDVVQCLPSARHPAFLLLARGSLNNVMLFIANRPQSPALPMVLEMPSMLMNYLSCLEAEEGCRVPCEGILAISNIRYPRQWGKILSYLHVGSSGATLTMMKS